MTKGAIGVVFRHRGPDNGYRFSMGSPDGRHAYRRLVRRTAGEDQVLWEDGEGHRRGQDYALVLRCEGETLIGELDGQRLFTIRDATHESGQVGLYFSGLAGPRFGGPVVDVQKWILHHAFAGELRPLPAGTRLRLYAGNADAEHDQEPGVQRRFMATGTDPGAVHLSSDGVALRLTAAAPAGGHSRWFAPASAYVPAELGTVRNADGTACFLAPMDGTPLEAGDYRVHWLYHRDNRQFDAAAAVLSQAGSTDPERGAIDLPWRIPWKSEAQESGGYPVGYCERSLPAALRKGTEIHILKRKPGPLSLHIHCDPSELPATDVWVLGPAGGQLWHGERIDLVLGSAPLRPDGSKRLEHSIDTDETGVFLVVFGGQAFPLHRRLTDDLSEAALLKPGARYRWAGSRGTFLNLGPTLAAIRVEASQGRIRVMDGESLYRELTDAEGSGIRIGAGTGARREVELQAVEQAAAGRLTVSNTTLFGSDADVTRLVEQRSR
jgi:hypothetical protein